LLPCLVSDLEGIAIDDRSDQESTRNDGTRRLGGRPREIGIAVQELSLVE